MDAGLTNMKPTDQEVENLHSDPRSYKQDYEDKEGSTSIIFSLPEKIGVLAAALKVFEQHGVNLHHIESRPARDDARSFEFYVACDNLTGGLKVQLFQYLTRQLFVMLAT
uniref:ACT domain-containing protein n=1 Tax=Biomphalaria glabrata TaxID=6526 RepID=A0A2C9L906_BIOGL